MRLLHLFVFSLVLIVSASACSLYAVENKQVGTWKKLPMPASAKDGNRNRYIHIMGTDKDGNPWAMIDQMLYYWDGTAFNKAAGFESKNSANSYMVGGNERDLYLLVPGKDPLHNDAYLLADGKVSFITECYMNRARQYMPVYVSKSGKLCNMSGRFLAVYTGSAWKKIETSLSSENTSIFDFGNMIYFYYNGNLCSIDSKNKITSKDTAVPPSIVDRQSAALWGKDTVITTDIKGTAAAFSLKTGELVTLPQVISDLFLKTSNSSLRSLPNGNVMFHHNANQIQRLVKIITSDGQVKSIDNLDTLGLRVFQNDIDPILNGPDGSYWLRASSGGPVQVIDNSAITYDWHTGAPTSTIRSINLGKKNTIYVHAEDGIYVYDPNGDNKRNEKIADSWQEYRLNSRAIQDSLGRIWCILTGHRMEISCWDGTKWTAIPYTNDKFFGEPSMADDRGNVLVSSTRFDSGCYVASLNGIKIYDSTKDALVALVADGSKWFDTREYMGCVVDKDKQIVLTGAFSRVVEFWDGKRWSRLTELPGDPIVMSSTKYGFLVRSEELGNVLYQYKDGQLTPLDPPETGSTNYLYGPNGVQPFDETLLKQRPSAYLTVDYNKLKTPKVTDSTFSADYIIAYNRHDPRGPLGRTRTGGFWLAEHQSNRIIFTKDDQAFPIDFTNTPFATVNRNKLRFYEDSQNNTWVSVGSDYGSTRLFMHNGPANEIKSPASP